MALSLIEQARALPEQFRAAQLPDSAYDEDAALAELDAVGYQAVTCATQLADALDGRTAVWAVVDRDHYESITAVYPTELEALRAVNDRGYGRAIELQWGQTLHEAEGKA